MNKKYTGFVKILHTNTPVTTSFCDDNEKPDRTEVIASQENMDWSTAHDWVIRMTQESFIKTVTLSNTCQSLLVERRLNPHTKIVLTCDAQDA